MLAGRPGLGEAVWAEAHEVPQASSGVSAVNMRG
jgi:hypothetical protein